jgi:hypothetical protein
MRAAGVLAGVLTLVGIPQLSLGSTGPDPFFGTWLLDDTQSHYAQGSMPERMTVVIESAPNGLAYRSEAQYMGGQMNSTHYVARLDKTPALVVGTNGYLAPISLTLIDDGIIDAVYTSGIKRVAWSRWSINPEGTELLVTTTYLNGQGEENRNVVLFRRVAPAILESGIRRIGSG